MIYIYIYIYMLGLLVVLQGFCARGDDSGAALGAVGSPGLDVFPERGAA